MNQPSQPLVVPSRQDLIKQIGLAGKLCLELGVQYGDFSKDILACDPSTLHLVDPWKHFTDDSYPSWANLKSQADQDSVYEGVLARFSTSPRVHVLRSTSVDAAASFPTSSLDFVYIDANHLLEHVIADLYLWYPKIKRGGWLAGHDYHLKRLPGVVKGLDMFMKVTGETIAVLTHSTAENDPPSWAIHKTQRL